MLTNYEKSPVCHHATTLYTGPVIYKDRIANNTTNFYIKLLQCLAILHFFTIIFLNVINMHCVTL